MDEIRVNAAIAEMQTLINSRIQRNLSFAGDMATLKVELDATKKELEKLKNQAGDE